MTGKSRMLHLRGLGLVAMTIGVVCALCRITDVLFERTADVNVYMEMAERLVAMSQDGEKALASLIEDDEVTWDPTWGRSTARVLAHLKQTDKMKMLIVGSSQLIVVRDDWTPYRYLHRVDTVIERCANKPLEVYNLAMGEMRNPEKTIVVESAFQRLHFDYVVVGLTPWDSANTWVRPQLAELRDATHDPGRLAPLNGANASGWCDPCQLNRFVSTCVDEQLKKHLPFYRRRSAIQRWCMAEVLELVRGDHDTTTEASSGRADRNLPKDATPMQFRFDQSEQEKALSSVNAMLDRLVDLKRQNGCEIAVLLNPFRQDERCPVFVPEECEKKLADNVRTRCLQAGFHFLDARTLLGHSHFGMHRDRRGKIDCLHFDAAGHEKLGYFIAHELHLL